MELEAFAVIGHRQYAEGPGGYGEAVWRRDCDLLNAVEVYDIMDR